MWARSHARERRPRVPQPGVQPRTPPPSGRPASPSAADRRAARDRRTAAGARSPGRAGSRGTPPREVCPRAPPRSRSTRACWSRNASCCLAIAARSHQRATTASAVAAKPRCSPRNRSTYGSSPQPLQRVPRLLVQSRRGDPHPGRRRAEAEPAEPGAQHMALVALRLRYGEDGEHPAVVRRRRGGGVHPPVAVVQQLAGVRRQFVSGRALRRTGRGEQPAALEPGDGRAYGRGVDADRVQEPDQLGDGQRRVPG